MRLVLERGVPQEERDKAALGSLTDWDAARVFLEVVRCGSFRSAAERLELSINGVRRRIDDFERQIGATLFTRDAHGTRLTEEGSLVVSAVERMEAASFDLLRAGSSVTNTLSGEVRVAITEGLGTFWLAPRLVEFQQSFPNILVDLHCAMRSADVSRHEADIAIHLSRPAALDVKLDRPFDIWLSYHPGTGRIPRVRHMIDWLVEAFNPAKFPWFKDEFVHPREFKAVYKGESLTHLFGGFSTEGR